MYESKKTKMKEGWDEMMAAVQASAEQEKGATGKFSRSKNPDSGGTVYSRKYNADTGQSIEPTKDPEGKSPVKRSVGRPNAGVTGSDEAGTKFGDYSSWYHKSKRTHGDRKIVGGRTGAMAVIEKGKKYLVVGKWENDEGVMFDKPSELVTLDALKSYKSGKGRPKKVREWIETLRFVSEGSVKEASKWRDPKFKDKLYTQEPDDGEGDHHDYYQDSRPENDPGEKRSTFDRSRDSDKLHYPYGDYQVGKQAQVGDRAKKGLLTKNSIRVVKDRIKGTQGDHPTPKLPK